MSVGFDDSHGTDSVDTDALLSRLRVIEDQPLDQRADAFAQVYDELRTRLEGSTTGLAAKAVADDHRGSDAASVSDRE